MGPVRQTSVDDTGLTPRADFPSNGRCRVVIDRLDPAVDGGRYPVKRELGDTMVVTCDLLADGHDPLGAVLLYRHAGEPTWRESPLNAVGSDRFRGSFDLAQLGTYLFTVEAWIDRWGGWRHGFIKKKEVGQQSDVDLKIGAELVLAAAARTTELRAEVLRQYAAALADSSLPFDIRTARALDTDLHEQMKQCPDRSLASRFSPAREVTVDRVRARYSSWYEFFPRSTGLPGEHGTLRDATTRLDYVAELGFDVVYLPPIHPIGTTFRKGRDNNPQASPSDPGSPWAIGASEGGHTAIHPQLGTLADFVAFRRRAEALGIEVALDFALQVSPDHPWVTEHPEWFVRRPDGSIQYAENPPKKYQDVYPFHFETESWPALWHALRDILSFWISQGVRIFRVDNPHTKPLPFWEWCIRTLKQQHPDLIFLAEAFTRPKLMAALAKLGFSQSYTYFTWRNSKAELTTYLQELTQTELVEFLRPNFWPNTPDILPQSLQFGGRPAFLVRLALAATLTANYGVYGPAYELLWADARPNSEEYLGSEKYELKAADLGRPNSLRHVMKRLNQVRKTSPALQRNSGLHFHDTDNEHVLCFSKRHGTDLVIVAVNLDYHHSQSTWLSLDLRVLDIEADEAYQVHDALSGARYLWHGARNYVELSPEVMPVQIFRVKRHHRSEEHFEYYL